jgi:acyl-CoA reductase-like NAD-dependent aldehyde dehydrogenase
MNTHSSLTTSTIRCVSPVNGEVYAERPALSFEAAMTVVERARAAQKGWARVPLAERVSLVQEGIRRLNGQKDRIVEELAWQMGRPVRYGGEFGGVNERASYMGSIAARRWRRWWRRVATASCARSSASPRASCSASRPGTIRI